MKKAPLSWLRGVVSLHVTGPQVERFINALTGAGTVIWDVKPSRNGMSLKLLLKDFYALRPLLKKTGCRLHITGREGVPFIMARLLRRKFFAAGLMLFAIGLFLLSSMVWSVDVEGNKRLAAEDVLDAARQEGIYPLQWIWRMDQPDKLSRELSSRLPGVSWIGVQRTGTAVKIQIVEAVEPDKKPLYLSLIHI